MAPQLAVVTAYGVAGVKEVAVLKDGESYTGKVVLFEPTRDVAIIRLDKPVGDPLELFIKPKISLVGERNGERMMLAGYPGGGDLTPTLASIDLEAVSWIVDAAGKEHELPVYLLDTTVVQGSSGSPMLDINGKVVGMIYGASTVEDENGRGYVVPTETFANDIERAKKAICMSLLLYMKSIRSVTKLPICVMMVYSDIRHYYV